ncbi:hypothetical protein N9Y92_03230 [Chlamydiales bacterium]|nr:hypothetical protein [Chlamydiales bacterium]
MKILRYITSAVILTLFVYGLYYSSYQDLNQNKKIGLSKQSYFDHTRNREVSFLAFYPVPNSWLGKKPKGVWKRVPIVENGPISSYHNSKYPLIVFSHGYGGSPGDLSWLTESFVHNGYIVISVAHSDINKEDNIQDHMWNRPLDVSFVLSQVLSSELGNHIDLERIGFVGFSIGGLTGVWLAGGVANLFNETHYIPTNKYTFSSERFSYLKEVEWRKDLDSGRNSFRDPRIKACFLIAPSWGWVFDQKGLKKISIPFEIVAPENDELIVTENNAGRFQKYIDGSKLILFPSRVGHFTFLNEIIESEIKSFDPDGKKAYLYIDQPGVCRARIHAKTSKLAIDFFYTHLVK